MGIKSAPSVGSVMLEVSRNQDIEGAWNTGMSTCRLVNAQRSGRSCLNLPVWLLVPHSGVSALSSQRHVVCLLAAVKCHSPMDGKQYGGARVMEPPGQCPLGRATLWLVG